MGGGWTWLDHATAADASAAGLHGVPGSVSEGTAADYLLVDLAVPEMLPSRDLEGELVRWPTVTRSSRWSWPEGRGCGKGWPVDWDARQLIEEAKHRAQKVLTDGPVRIVHPTATERRGASRANRRTEARE